MPTTNYSAISRIFAYLALSTTIGAIAWLIRDPLLAAIGIPGLAMGHFYSWRKGKMSIVRSLILLFFMVLTVFLGGDILLSGLSDRMLLSRYLVYGLVIGSFDLTSKRNVQASLVLGVMLMILISELALNFWFVIFVVAFTIFTLVSALVSRMESEADKAVLVGESKLFISGRTWAGFIAGAMIIAVAAFLFMPRVASNQIAQAGWLPNRIDLALGNSLGLPAKPSAYVSPGLFPSVDYGETADGERYGSLGYTGSAADEVVMNVRSRISSYWRGMTLDEYDGRGWLNSSPQVTVRNRDRGEFELSDSRAGSADDRAYWQIYYMLADQPSALFTGYYPGRIYLPELPRNYLEEGVLYRALSYLPNITPDLLRGDRTVPQRDFLALPPITERTETLAESIVENAATDYDKAASIEQFLYKNYPYKLDVEPLPQGKDAADYFLFEEQAGYCSHFATAMAVMSRHVGLSARVATGYLPGYIDTLTGAHIVRAGDAHAWVEIYFQRNGWVAFDPTPRADAAMGFAAERNLVYFGLEDYIGGDFGDIFSPLGTKFSLGKVSLPGWSWALLALFAVAVIITAVMLRGNLKKRARKETLKYSALEGEDRKKALDLYRKMVGILAKKGIPDRLAYQPPYEYAAAIFSQVPEARETVEYLTVMASNAAYNPERFVMPDISSIRKSLSALRQALSG